MGAVGQVPIDPVFVNVPYWCWESPEFRQRYETQCWEQANRCSEQLRQGALSPECQLCAVGQQAPEACHMNVLNECTSRAIAEFCPWEKPPQGMPVPTPPSVVDPPRPPLPPLQPTAAPKASVWPWVLGGLAAAGVMAWALMGSGPRNADGH
jgi:hypothetical protein